MESKENTRTNKNIQKVTESKTLIHIEEKVTIPTEKLKMKTKLKKRTHIVEETKEAVNKIEESEYLEFQSEVIQTTEDTEKPAKRTYEMLK